MCEQEFGFSFLSNYWYVLRCLFLLMLHHKCFFRLSLYLPLSLAMCFIGRRQLIRSSIHSFYFFFIDVNMNVCYFFHLPLIAVYIKCIFSGALTKSQFPVFTIYAQKSCLSVRPCSRAWCIDRVQNYKLNGFTKRSTTANSRQDCFEMCLGENEFTCR